LERLRIEAVALEEQAELCEELAGEFLVVNSKDGLFNIETLASFIIITIPSLVYGVVAVVKLFL
jgi:hypothetical protein